MRVLKTDYTKNANVKLKICVNRGIKKKAKLVDFALLKNEAIPPLIRTVNISVTAFNYKKSINIR